MNPIIDLERPLEKVLKVGQYVASKCHNTPGDNDSGSYEINLPYYRGWSPQELLVWLDKLLKALNGQGINKWPLEYTFTEKLLTDDAKDAFNLAALDIGICTVDNFNKVQLKLTRHKRYLHRRLLKSRGMKLRSFISKPQELNAYLEEYPSDTEGQETAP